VLERMVADGQRPNVHSFTTLMNAYSREGSTQQAEDVLTRMISAGIRPNVYSYTTLMGAYSRACDPAGAADVLRRMREAGVKPNAATYNSLLIATSRLGTRRGSIGERQAKQLLQTYDEMRRSVGDIRPNAGTFVPLLTAVNLFPRNLTREVYPLILEDFKRFIPVRDRGERLYAGMMTLTSLVDDIKAHEQLYREVKAKHDRGELTVAELLRLDQVTAG
jgi:pentatricopeptide repeat protein